MLGEQAVNRRCFPRPAGCRRVRRSGTAMPMRERALRPVSWRGRGEDVGAVDLDGSCVWFEQAEDVLEQDGFPAGGGAAADHDAVEVAVRDVEIDAVEHEDFSPKLLRRLAEGGFLGWGLGWSRCSFRHDAVLFSSARWVNALTTAASAALADRACDGLPHPFADRHGRRHDAAHSPVHGLLGLRLSGRRGSRQGSHSFTEVFYAYPPQAAPDCVAPNAVGYRKACQSMPPA